MVRKIYRKLTEEQKKRGVIFSSCLSRCKDEQTGDTLHEVFELVAPNDKMSDFNENQRIIKNLKDDKFFRDSHFKYNIIRT